MVNYLDLFFGHLTVNILCIFSDVSLRNISIFCRTSHFELSRYSVRHFIVNILSPPHGVSQRMVWSEISQNVVVIFAVNYLIMFSGVSRWIILIICLVSQGELPCYFVRPFTIHNLDIFFGFLMVNYLDILSGASLRIFLIFFGRLKVKCLDILSGASLRIFLIFVGRLKVKCVDILSGVSKWNTSMLCWSTHDGFSWYLFGRLAVNGDHIPSDPSLWKFFIIVELLVVDYLKIMLGISRWILSNFFLASRGELSRHFFGCPKVIFLDILLDVSLWICFHILSVTLRWFM